MGASWTDKGGSCGSFVLLIAFPCYEQQVGALFCPSLIFFRDRARCLEDNSDSQVASRLLGDNVKCREVCPSV